MKYLFILLSFLIFSPKVEAALPSTDGTIQVEGQFWPLMPQTRMVTGYIYYPGGSISNVNSNTCLMLSLHNWGGVNAQGTAHPVVMANTFNCIAITVDYLQSGNAAFGPLPYEHGLYQAVDVIRVLHRVFQDLKSSNRAFDDKRILVIGGSGGGHVALMVYRMAPRTISGIVTMSAPIQPKFGPPLDSRWGWLPPHEFRIRDMNDAYINAQTLAYGGGQTSLLMIHGVNDQVVHFWDAWSAAQTLNCAFNEINTPVFPFLDTGHTLGDRTYIALHHHVYYGTRRNNPTDFEYADTKIRYNMGNGSWVMDYRQVPTLQWVN